MRFLRDVLLARLPTNPRSRSRSRLGELLLDDRSIARERLDPRGLRDPTKPEGDRLGSRVGYVAEHIDGNVRRPSCGGGGGRGCLLDRPWTLTSKHLVLP
mgnify:CR=1 FL=1